jgi:hypothetical protein
MRRTHHISLKSNNPFIRTCPRLWEKRIYPPKCVEYLTRADWRMKERMRFGGGAHDD